MERQGIDGTRGGGVVQEFDNYGRVIRTRSEGFGGTEVIEETGYDQLGRLLGQSLPHTAATAVVPTIQYAYDHLDRVTRIEHSGEQPSSQEYQYASGITLASAFRHWLGGLQCPAPHDVEKCAVGVALSIGEEGHKNVVITDHRGLVVRNVDGNNVDVMQGSSNYRYGGFNHLLKANRQPKLRHELRV